MKNTILIVDDNELNRQILDRMLRDEYIVLQAANGIEALKIIEERYADLSAVVLDWVMPKMDGRELLQIINGDDKYKNLPVLIATGEHDTTLESECLEIGAWDYVKKPYDPLVLRLRLDNIIGRSQTHLMQQIQELAERDILTGLYNRRFFMKCTERMLRTYADEQFVLIHMDVDHFRLYNASFGSEAGDELLREIAHKIEEEINSNKIDKYTYGRIESDVFCICIPYHKKKLEELLLTTEQHVQEIEQSYRLKASFGLYVIEKFDEDMEEMYSHSVEAAKKCKNDINTFYAYYDNTMSEQAERAQRLTNELDKALSEEQFRVYLQPKYSIEHERPCGAEALVRWFHPSWGMVSPGDFIPVFEQNGSIVQLDYYMWEHVCQVIQKWIKNKETVYPISVNISRISMYNPQIVEQIVELTERYEIPKYLLNLEITESAYMSNPDLMKETIERLRTEGFVILIDDFGSGYSSLNTLKDIDVDILKIDMEFLPTGHNNVKSEKILASIARMAGWLGMPVIVEGVETIEQKEFLESIGCPYVQGFYYAKPMPVEDYEKLIAEQKPLEEIHPESSSDMLGEFDEIWSSDSETGALFKSVSVPFAILEYADSGIDILRINQAFKKEFDSNSFERILMYKESYKLQTALDEVEISKGNGECECFFVMPNGAGKWERIRLNYIGEINKASLISATFADITTERKLEQELNGVFNVINEQKIDRESLLVIDDLELSREIVVSLFENDYNILQASNGQEGLDILEEQGDDIAAILLDMVMPVMDGQEFLAQKNAMQKVADIPVIIISSENDANLQIHMLQNGVNDYITKPFVPAVVKKRLQNVLEYNSRFRRLVNEYHEMNSIDLDVTMGDLTGFGIHEVRELMRFMGKVFDLVRLVDPVETAVVNITDDDKTERVPYSCFSVWDRKVRCDNCSSLCALKGHCTMNKFELLKNDLFYVVSQPVEVILENNTSEFLVLEVVSKVSDYPSDSIAETKKVFDMLENTHSMIYTDPLTQAFNRRFLDEFLFLHKGQNEVAKEVTIIMMDLYQFKQTNDLFGHQVGDTVLKGVVAVLEEQIRCTDSIIRYGGDEFIIVLTGCPEEKVPEFIQRFRKAVGTVTYGPKGTLRTEADFGYSYTKNFRENKKMLDEMLDDADVKMYENKKNHIPLDKK